MKENLTEQEVLCELDINDFEHIPKEKIIPFANMLSKMDSEVAQKALANFPNFSETMGEIFEGFNQLLIEGMQSNAEGFKAYYQICEKEITSCQHLLEQEELGFDEKRYILERMDNVRKMLGEKITEDKQFIEKIHTKALTALGITVGAVFMFFLPFVKQTKTIKNN